MRAELIQISQVGTVFINDIDASIGKHDLGPIGRPGRFTRWTGVRDNRSGIGSAQHFYEIAEGGTENVQLPLEVYDLGSVKRPFRARSAGMPGISESQLRDIRAVGIHREELRTVLARCWRRWHDRQGRP